MTAVDQAVDVHTVAAQKDLT